MIRLVVVFIFVSLSLLACPGAPIDMGPSCTPASCGGCCNGDRCETGTSDAACGSSGVTCSSCAVDLTCNAGRCVAREVEPQDSGVPPKRVFVTRTGYSGNLKSAGSAADGLAGADALCAIAAQSMSLGGTWRAWLSTTTVKAQDRIAGDGPWVDLKGNVVFNNKANFFTGPLRPIEFDERGATTVTHFTSGDTQGVAVWSGTTSSLTVTRAPFGAMETRTCLDWTDADGSQQGGFGTSDNSDNGWTEFHSGVVPEGAAGSGDGATQCNGSGHLLCFEQ